MADEQLTAWVGHVLVVGGRAVRMAPPGALTQSAPRRAPRARENDVFGILVVPAADTQAPADFYTTLAELAVDTYFGSGGGVTGGLREALTALNDHVLVQVAPGDQPPLVDAVALVLRGSEVYLARCGRMFAVLWNGTALTVLPTDRTDALVMNIPSLGAASMPDMQLARYTVAPGDALLLADARLRTTSNEVFQQALTQPALPAILEQLKTLESTDMALSVIQFAPPETVAPPDFAVIPSPRDPRESRPASPVRLPMRPTSRPASHSSRPAIPRVPLTAPELPGEGEAATDTQDMPPMPDTLPELAPLAPSQTPDQAQPAPTAAPFADDAIPPVAAALPEEAESVPTEQPSTESGGHRLGARLQGVFHTLTPGEDEDAAPIATHTAPRAARASQPVRQVREGVRGVQRRVLGGLLAIINGIASAFEEVLPTPDEDGKQGIPTNIAVGMAISIPIVIVVAVVGFALSRQGESEFESYRAQAQVAHSTALALSGGNCENEVLRDKWVEVLQLARQAAKLRPNDLEVLSIRADAQNYLDCYDEVERRDLTLLHEFSGNADLVGPILNESGVDLYTLDRANNIVYHDTLTPAGNQLTNRNNDPLIFEGQAIGAFVVGEMFDIEWLSSGGTRHDNVLLALDRDGVLVAYSQTFLTNAQQLVTEARWVDPVAMAIFGQNLYVLDRGASQIWRYVPPPGERQYSRAPEEYFNGNAQPDLSLAVDFGIDRNGAVHILFGDGSMRKFRSNSQGVVEEQPFSYQRQPEGAFKSGTVLFVDNDQASSSLHIIDQANETIYETSWAGRYNTGYRPRNLPDAFQLITGFYADTVVRNNMYVLADGKLYHFYRHEP